jgi:hypothetical protein
MSPIAVNATEHVRSATASSLDACLSAHTEIEGALS